MGFKDTLKIMEWLESLIMVEATIIQRRFENFEGPKVGSNNKALIQIEMNITSNCPQKVQ